LPGYVNFLFNWKIPKELEEETTERLGFKAYLNPEILDDISDSSREIRLAEILIRFLGVGKKREVITVENLYEEMSKNDSPVCKRISALCRNEQSMGHLLTALEKATKAGKPVLRVNVARRKSSVTVS